jgi:hypothetical protein
VSGSLRNREPAVSTQGQHAVTRDGRYFVARGKLWRLPNPNLAPGEKKRAHRLVDEGA